jgi:hypothetical protein
MTALDIANGALTGGAGTVTFTARYEVIEVKNEDPTNSLYVTTNGTTPSSTAGAEGDEYEVGPGERVQIPNTGPMWWQGYSTNPGTTVMIASASATAAYEVLGAG